MKTAGASCHMPVGTSGNRYPFIDSSSGGLPYASDVLVISWVREPGEGVRGMNGRGGNIEGCVTAGVHLCDYLLSPLTHRLMAKSFFSVSV